jgi:malate dehydrogenase
VTTVAIVGAGPIGAAVAHRLASRNRVSAIRLIDANVAAASGKALDMQQAGPVEAFGVRITAAPDPLSAAGASAIVIADAVDEGEWSADRGLALVGEIGRANAEAPVVFAGPGQADLMERVYRRGTIRRQRLIGSAAGAIVGTVRSLAGLELGVRSVDVTVVGRPPSFVIGWSAAAVSGSLVTDQIPAHRLLAIGQALTRLWPPGPQAIGSATAPIVEALIEGSRQWHPALTIVDGELGARGTAVLLPLALGSGRVLRHVMPSLSPQERTDLENLVR